MASSPAPSTLEQDFRNALASLAASRRATPWPTAPGKGLELWLLFKIATDLKAHGWKVTLRDGAGGVLGATAPFLTRAQPGRIGPKQPSMPGFIQAVRPAGLGREEAFELHGGLQYRGRSGARHECDISALPAPIGRNIRNRGGGCPSGMPPVAIETKHHKSDGTIGEAREKLARLFDLTFVKLCHPRNNWQVFWANFPRPVGWGRRYNWYRDRFRDGVYAIARTSDFQPGAETLLQHYDLRRFPAVTTQAGLQNLLNAVHNHLS